MDGGCLGTPARTRPAQSSCGSPDRGTLSTPLSRRRLLVAGLTAGTAAVVGASAAAAAPPVAVWGLDPDGGHQGCGCSACSACQAHALNKIFASAADANGGRAHPHCRCAVTQLALVESYVHDALFVQGGQRASVDRRQQWVQAALASAPPVPPPSSSPDVGSTAGTSSEPDTRAAQSSVGGSTAVVPAAPKLRSAWVRRLAPGRRMLYVQVETGQPSEATIALLRDHRRLVQRHLPELGGLQTIRVPLDWDVTRGPARLQIRFRDGAGKMHTATRMVSVPAKRPRRKRYAASVS